MIYIYIERERERERGREAETQAEGEAGSMHREPDMGLDPGTPGPCPGPKAGAKPLSHPGIPGFDICIHYKIIIISLVTIYHHTKLLQYYWPYTLPALHI